MRAVKARQESWSEVSVFPVPIHMLCGVVTKLSPDGCVKCFQ